MVRATVIADASYDHQCGAAGWAAWIRVDGIGQAIRVFGPIRKALARSSTEAEVRAAIFGIEAATRRGASAILIQSDCLAVIQGSHDVWKDFLARNPGLVVDARHVPGHTDGQDARTWVNNWCDRMARREMRRKRRSM